MTVKKNDTIYFTTEQLIEALKKFPSDMPVLVSGYESGYENFFEPFSKKVKHVPENPYYDGEFQDSEEENGKVIEAVVLQRVVRDD